jgi:membrane peptidoglycan carboxypeptidase
VAVLPGLAAAIGSIAFGPQAPPPVSAGAPRVRPAPDAPLQVLEQLPVGRGALALGAMSESGQSAPAGSSGTSGRLFEIVRPSGAGPLVQGPLRVEYSLDAELTRRVYRVLDKGRVKLGHVIVLDPATGRLLVYASTDPETFHPSRHYPAASLVKVITAAAVLGADPEVAKLPCRYTGNPYRLTPSRVAPPRHGREISLRRALATSNNQCFAQLAVHALGGDELMNAIERFGWLAEPAPAHSAGVADPGDDRYDVGRLGCGLAGCRITPLHAAQLAGTLAHGELVAPRWIDRVVDVHGRELPLPASAAPRRVMSPELADELRAMLVDTTTRGTARSAFRRRNGRPLLGEVRVAGKTGSLSGRDPKGRYEWFVGVAPAEEPRIAVSVLLVQGHLWWRNASQIAAEVLRQVFCPDRGVCGVDAASRWLAPATAAAGASEARPAGGSRAQSSRISLTTVPMAPASSSWSDSTAGRLTSTFSSRSATSGGTASKTSPMPSDPSSRATVARTRQGSPSALP